MEGKMNTLMVIIIILNIVITLYLSKIDVKKLNPSYNGYQHLKEEVAKKKEKLLQIIREAMEGQNYKSSAV